MIAFKFKINVLLYLVLLPIKLCNASLILHINEELLICLEKVPSSIIGASAAVGDPVQKCILVGYISSDEQRIWCGFTATSFQSCIGKILSGKGGLR